MPTCKHPNRQSKQKISRTVEKHTGNRHLTNTYKQEDQKQVEHIRIIRKQSMRQKTETEDYYTKTGNGTKQTDIQTKP